jgi:glycosyltransferase involved in cell wall biosynthesis
MSLSPWHICVLVPARNEEDLLPRCLESIIAAELLLPIKAKCDIVVAVDFSSDRTHEIAAEALLGRGAVVCSEAGVVGQARALAATVALDRYKGSLQRCWIANTDADCCVPRTWLADQLSLANEGIEAIAGTIDVDDFSEHGAGVERLFRSSYLIDPDGTHPHVHGANLGIRADTYLRAGGWANLCTAEDHDLWNRLVSKNLRRISTDAVKVITSGRRIGRAPLGFADALAAHNECAA